MFKQIFAFLKNIIKYKEEIINISAEEKESLYRHKKDINGLPTKEIKILSESHDVQ